jgi:hypothetical protein
MASRRFFGQVGYATPAVETAPDVFKATMVEYSYYGDVVRNSRQLESSDKVNNDLSVNNSISIVADEYANEHFHAIRYIRWAGALWTVSDVEVQSPRLLLRLGGVYNGPTSGS